MMTPPPKSPSKTTGLSLQSADAQARCHQALDQVAAAIKKLQDEWDAGKHSGKTYVEYFGPLAEHQIKVLKILAALEAKGSANWDSILDDDKI